MEKQRLLFIKASDKARVPTRGSKVSAGFDLYSAYDVVIPARRHAQIGTDIKVQLPPGTYGKIAPRSGLALNNGVDIGAGVIDEDFRGCIGILIFNHSDQDFHVKVGDRIAQLICEKICHPDLITVNSLNQTEQNDKGFVSTGPK
ncbi:dUTPase [Drosophila suzukii associated hytrosavirus 1]|nr:dUTPase [Drosophila suzukii associated hytrosavirus 1]